MIDYLAFTVMNAADTTRRRCPARSTSITGVVDVSFNEPVGLATAQVPGNYQVTGATVTAAMRDAVNLNVVHLTLAADIGASASMYTVTVTGVKDLAGNPIAAVQHGLLRAQERRLPRPDGPVPQQPGAPHGASRSRATRCP